MLKILYLVYMILYDLQYIAENMKRMGYKLFHFESVIFQFLTMFNTIIGAGAVGAGAASLYGSGSDQKMRLLAAPASQHCLQYSF
jgi:hypothetical protein